MQINQGKFQKMTEFEHSETTAKDYQLVLFSKDELEEKMKIDQEEFEKMTELEREWELFKRAELKEQWEKWIEIKRKLDQRKKLNDVTDCKN